MPKTAIESMITVVVLGLAAYGVSLAPAGGAGHHGSVASPYAVGQPAPIPRELARKSHHTLVVMLSTHCRYCAASMPFYRRLRRAAGHTTQFVIVSAEPRESIQRFVANQGLSVADIVTSALPIKVTPVLLVANAHGTVEAAWVGRLDPQQEEDVIHAVLK